jgi:hypothetical protein
MKNDSYKPKRITDGYQMKKHLHGGFRIIEHWHFSNETNIRRRCVAKHLDLNEAEDLMYRLEAKLNK